MTRPDKPPPYKPHGVIWVRAGEESLLTPTTRIPRSLPRRLARCASAFALLGLLLVPGVASATVHSGQVTFVEPKSRG